MTRNLSTTQGTAMLLGGVLGPGLLVLPRLASEAAGPAAIIAWAGLLTLSVPVALTFATLGERHPDGGGVANFARLAFGGRAATVTGLWFYCAVPIGTVAGAIVGGRYAASLFGAGQGFADVAACTLLAAAVAANAIGLHASGRVQTVLVLSLAALLTVSIALAAPHVEAHEYTPFAPHGLSGVTQAAGVLVFAFVGWEAVSHLSAEFAPSTSLSPSNSSGPPNSRNASNSASASNPPDPADAQQQPSSPPDRSDDPRTPADSNRSSDPRAALRHATWWTLGVVGLLYLGLAIVSAGTGASRSPIPLQALLASGIGGLATPLTGTAAVVLTFGAINTYIASAARLGASLAREGVLPGRFADAPDREPRRSLGLLAVVTGLITAVALIGSVDVDVLIRATSACLAAVNVLGMAAAVRLLPPGRPRAVAATATVLAVAALACCTVFLAFPAALATVAILLPGRRDQAARRFRSGAGTVIEPATGTAKI